MEDQEIRNKVRQFILEEFLPGEDPDELKDDTELLSSGILDSIATLKLVTHLEESFQITIEAHEADAENLDTVADITALVKSKR